MAGPKRFWTTSRLMHMRDKILPQSSGIHEALGKAQKKWRTPGELAFSALNYNFKKEFGQLPSDFLQTQIPKSHLGEIEILKKRLRTVEADLRDATKDAAGAAMIKNLIHGASLDPPKPPVWLVQEKKQKLFHGVPTLFISDIHHGETVFEGQVDGVNRFNPDISRRRVQRTFERCVFLCKQVFNESVYPGIVCALGGDIVSGNIHEELRETNAQPIFKAVTDIADILIAGIELLRQEFGKVFVPCVVGNHGRLDRKPRAKYGPHDNFEYILYHLLARHFQDDPDVNVVVPDSFTCSYRIFDTRYLLIHGDSLPGGNGISGPILAWMKGDYRLRKQKQSAQSWTGTEYEYDVLLFGHWHKFFPGINFIGNGSVKGFDEFAKKMGYDFEPPQQALWMTTPDRGITFVTRIFCEDPPRKTKPSKNWVAMMEAA